MKKVLALVIAVMAIMCILTGCKSDDYEAAMKLYDIGNYDAAQQAFSELKDYKASEEMLEECKYQNALIAIRENDLDTAITLLSELDDYKESTDLLNDCKYQKALSAADEMDFDTAITLFAELGDYKNSATYLGYEKSQIEGVSDNTYFYGMYLLDKYMSSDYQEQLRAYFIDLINSYKGNWEERTGSKEAELIINSEPVQRELSTLQQIAGDGTNDEDFAAVIKEFYALVLDNAWGHATGDGECTSVFSLLLRSVKILSSSYVSNLFDAASNLDSFLPVVYNELHEMENMDDMHYLSILASLTICKKIFE